MDDEVEERLIWLMTGIPEPGNEVLEWTIDHKTGQEYSRLVTKKTPDSKLEYQYIEIIADKTKH